MAITEEIRPGIRLLVCGGRDYEEKVNAREMVKKTIAAIRPGLIIEGGAEGADRLAGYAAVELEIPYHTYHADWEQYGRKAGFIRNSQMLKEGKPDLVLAFPGGKGTAMMVSIALKAGVPVIMGDFMDWQTP